MRLQVLTMRLALYSSECLVTTSEKSRFHRLRLSSSLPTSLTSASAHSSTVRAMMRPSGPKWSSYTVGLATTAAPPTTYSITLMGALHPLNKDGASGAQPVSTCLQAAGYSWRLVQG